METNAESPLIFYFKTHILSFYIHTHVLEEPSKMKNKT